MIKEIYGRKFIKMTIFLTSFVTLKDGQARHNHQDVDL